MLDPGVVLAKRNTIFCWCDRQQRIVVRGRRAIQLGFVQFAIFWHLHEASMRAYDRHKTRRPPKARHVRVLYDLVYAGVADPPQFETLYFNTMLLNKKLAYLGLKVTCENHSMQTIYELRALP